MSVIPERPASADSAERAHRAYLKEIDYHSSIMNGEVLRRQATIEMKKANTLKKMRVAAPDGSIAEKEGEEDENINMMTIPLPKEKSLGKTMSNMNLMEGNLSHREDEFQSALYHKYVECQYLISVLKNKSVQVREV